MFTFWAIKGTKIVQNTVKYVKIIKFVHHFYERIQHFLQICVLRATFIRRICSGSRDFERKNQWRNWSNWYLHYGQWKISTMFYEKTGWDARMQNEKEVLHNSGATPTWWTPKNPPGPSVFIHCSVPRVGSPVSPIPTHRHTRSTNLSLFVTAQPTPDNAHILYRVRRYRYYSQRQEKNKILPIEHSIIMHRNTMYLIAEQTITQMMSD